MSIFSMIGGTGVNAGFQQEGTPALSSTVDIRGDSIGGGGLSSSFPTSWVGRMVADKGVGINQYSVAGIGTEYSTKSINRRVALNQKLTQFLSWSINDITYKGDDPKSFVGMRDGYRHAIASCLMARFVPANNSLVTYAGATRADIAVAGIDPKSAAFHGKAQTVTGLNATITYAFDGTNVGFLFYHAQTAAGQTVEVRIDSVLVDSFGVNNTSSVGSGGDGITVPAGRTYFNLTDGAHSIEIKVTGASGNFWLDGFHQLQLPQYSPLVIVISAVKLFDSTYDSFTAGYPPPRVLDDSVIDDYRDVIFEACDEFITGGYTCVKKVDVNTHYVANLTNTNADGLHPNDAGHGLYYQAVEEVLP